MSKMCCEFAIDTRDLDGGRILPLSLLMSKGAPVEYLPILDAYIIHKKWKLSEVRTDPVFAGKYTLHIYRFEEI